MGGTGWHYHTDWSEDLDHALQTLRAKVFASGDYYKFWQEYGDASLEAGSIDEALELAETEGTHSILDIMHVGAGFGGAQLLGEDQLQARCGTATPTREQVSAAMYEMLDELPRWHAYIVPTYEGGVPTGLLFVGVSGD